MEQKIDRKRIGSSFNRQAGEYDRHAEVQKRVVDRLVSLVGGHLCHIPNTILDVGCGTGQLLAALNGRYPEAVLNGLDLAHAMLTCSCRRLGSGACLVNGDAEQLPYRDACIDLLVSTSTLQWLDSLEPFFHEAERVLAPEGLLCAAFFGGQTLHELHECLREASETRSCCSSGEQYVDRLHRFKERAELEKALERSGFDRAVVLSDIEMEQYADVFDLLRTIKRIGAGTTARRGETAGLGWKSVMQETARLYDHRYGVAGRIPATYEVFYVVAEKKRR